MTVKLTHDPSGALCASIPFGGCQSLFDKQLAAQTGCGSPESAQRVLRNLLSGLELTTQSPVDDINAAIGALLAMEPQSPLEAELICQALSSSHFATKLLRKSSHGNPESQEQWLKLSMRLMRLYTQQIETLSRWRRQGQQSMVIKHLHVSDNSQAVIGPMSMGANLI